MDGVHVKSGGTGKIIAKPETPFSVSENWPYLRALPIHLNYMCLSRGNIGV